MVKPLLFLSPIVALFAFWLFVPELRIVGIICLVVLLVGFHVSPLYVRIRPCDVLVVSPLRSVQYDLRQVKDVAIDKVQVGHGTTMVSVRIDFFHRKPVQIAGFGSRDNFLFETISAALRYCSRQNQI